jgi:hypothetical protein
MERIKEIFAEIALSIRATLPIMDGDFRCAVLEIKRLRGNVGFKGHYLTYSNEKKWLDIFNLQLDSKLIHELYDITQVAPLIHKNWNRANFTLYPNNKFEIEYIWDQALQDEVDKYNNS